MKSKSTYQKKPKLQLPKHYERYEAQLDKVEKISPLAKSKLHRFPYRYRLAKSFIGIEASEAISNRDLIGYSAGMKVFLAYTAFDEIITAANEMKIPNVGTKGNTQLTNALVASQLRKNVKLMWIIQQSIAHYEYLFNTKGETDGLALKLKSFTKHGNDILCVAQLIRNLYAHGEFTAGGVGITSQATKAPFNLIANEVLTLCDDIFERCVLKLESMR